MEHTITGLEVQKRSPERVSVYLDGEFAFGLPAIEAARLHQGQVLSEVEIAALRALDDLSRAIDYAARLLARRPYSSAEIRRSLAAREVAPTTIEEALARLESLGYVDDRAFAQFWVENRERFRPRSPQALRHELRQKGLAADIIEAALSALDARESAVRAAQEPLRRLRGQTRAEVQIRLGAFLARRGFDYDVIREAVEAILAQLDEEDPEYFSPDKPMNDYEE
ncbi:MAG: RecX family transcriptional regulator [Anaerolineae bacterium]|nr:RecX family transcriptional regulator [Anaerolineae bacterium]